MTNKIHLFGDITSESISQWPEISVSFDEKNKSNATFSLRQDPSYKMNVLLDMKEDGTWIARTITQKTKKQIDILNVMLHRKPFVLMTESLFEIWISEFDEEHMGSNENVQLAIELTRESIEELGLFKEETEK